MISNFTPDQTGLSKDRAWVPGFAGFYCADRAGVVYSVGGYRNRWHYGKLAPMHPGHNNHGYETVTLSIGAPKAEHYTVETIMALVWLGLEKDDLGRASELVVDHIDDNRVNNDLANLQIISRRENLRKRDVDLQTGAPKRAARKPLKAIDIKTGAVDYYISGRAASIDIKGDISIAPLISMAAKNKIKQTAGKYWFLIDWKEYNQKTGQNII